MTAPAYPASARSRRRSLGNEASVHLESISFFKLLAIGLIAVAFILFLSLLLLSSI